MLVEVVILIVDVVVFDGLVEAAVADVPMVVVVTGVVVVSDDPAVTVSTVDVADDEVVAGGSVTPTVVVAFVVGVVGVAVVVLVVVLVVEVVIIVEVVVAVAVVVCDVSSALPPGRARCAVTVVVVALAEPDRGVDVVDVWEQVALIRASLLALPRKYWALSANQ